MWPTQSISSNTTVFSLPQRKTIWDLGGNPIVKEPLWYSLLMQASRTSMPSGWFSQASMGTIPETPEIVDYFQPLTSALEAEIFYSVTTVWNVQGQLRIQKPSKVKSTSRVRNCSRVSPSPYLKLMRRVMALNVTLSGILNGKTVHIYYVLRIPKVKYQQPYSIKHFTQLFSLGEEKETIHGYWLSLQITLYHVRLCFRSTLGKGLHFHIFCLNLRMVNKRFLSVISRMTEYHGGYGLEFGTWRVLSSKFSFLLIWLGQSWASGTPSSIYMFPACKISLTIHRVDIKIKLTYKHKTVLGHTTLNLVAIIIVFSLGASTGSAKFPHGEGYMER